MTKRKIKKIPIARELIKHVFTETKPNEYRQIVQGVPEDARFHNMYHDQETNTYYLIFSHEDWEHIPFGKTVPELEIKVDEIRDKDHSINSVLGDVIKEVSQLHQDRLLYGKIFFHTEHGRLDPEKTMTEKHTSPNPDNTPDNPGWDRK